MDLSIVIILFVFGILGGFLSGLLGVGGGIVFVPVLSYVLVYIGVDGDEMIKFVLANSFAATFFAGAISSYKQYKLKSFYLKEILYTAMVAIPLSLMMTYSITTGTWYSEESFSVFFVVLLIFMLLRFMFVKQIRTVDRESVKMYKYPVTGLITGIISALSGLGGGVIMIPLFTQFNKLNIREAASISIGVIPLMMIPMIIAYAVWGPESTVFSYQTGYLLPTVFLPLVGGLLFAAPFGVSVGQKSSQKFLKIIFASLLTIVIIKTIGNII